MQPAAEQFLEKISASLTKGTFVRLLLSGAKGSTESPEKILVRSIDLKGMPQLSFTLRYKTRDVTKNLVPEDGLQQVRLYLEKDFRNALLGTTQRDWQLSTSTNGTARLVSHKPSQTEAPPRAHDRPRETMLDGSANDWLSGLGVTDAKGKVFPAMADKHRQISHYLEILSHLAKDCGWAPADHARPDGCKLALADMGCGKGYLTFGAWHLFHRLWQIPVRVIGVEERDELAATTNQLAQKIKADGLEFIPGKINSIELPRVDALIALHACNTATDDAILQGIEAGAKLILVAPCCHKEIRPQLGQPAPLTPVLQHGVMEERMAEWVTDGLRALFLEWAGYRTKIFEFVASEHTPKNLMISAVREKEKSSSPAARKQIEDLKTFFGIKHHALDPLLK